MSDEPLTFKPTWPYLLVLASTLLVWTVLAIEITGVFLVIAYQQLDTWIAISSIFLVTPIIPLLIITRSFKRSIEYNDVEWDFKERDVTYSEYQLMMRDYTKGYSMVLQNTPYFKIIASIIIAIVAVLHLYIIIALDELLLVFFPYSFGVLLLLYGLLLTQSIYNMTPTDAGIHFPYTPPSVVESAIRIFEQILGISWTGIKITIGEAAGFFTVRSPRIVARIEEIESAVEIECVIDEHGQPKRILSRFDNIQSSKIGEIISIDYTKPDDILNVVRESVKSYIQSTGSTELLEDLIDELGITVEISSDSHSDNLQGSE